MPTITDRLYAQARIYPVQEPNRVKSIKKLDSGALEVTQNSGQVFTIEPEDALFQVFIVYMVLSPDACPRTA